MRGRQLLLLSPLLILFCSSPVNATTEVGPKVVTLGNDRLSDLDLDLPEYDYAPAMSWADSVMMTRLPPGSLIIRYDGPQKLIIKHARSQVRRYARRYNDYSEGPRPQIDVWNETVDLNAWWTRSWMASLPPEKGGAPAQPYVHTIGNEITWRLGPLTFSNTLRLKIDYVAVFRFNPDPGEKTSDRNPPPASFDIHPARSTSIGSSVRVKFRPVIRIGLPNTDGWLSTIRSLALRADINIVVFGVRFLQGEILLKYEPDDDELTLSFGISLVNW